MLDSFPRSGERVVPTAQAARELGRELGAALEAGDVVILEGPLGAGKTTFTQGIGAGMQVKGRITSPTFIIAREHASLADGPGLVHVDAYRMLDDSGSLDSLDLESELEDCVVVAEWGGGLLEGLSQEYLRVVIDREVSNNAAGKAGAEDASDEAADFDELKDADVRLISWSWEAAPGA